MPQRFFTQQDTNLVYLDANATTPVLPCISDVVTHTMQVCFGNPSSSHITGVQAKYLMEQTRDKARQVIGAMDGDILFTSGATEGIQTAIVSTLLAKRHLASENSVLLYGATEHKAVPNTLAHWNKVLGINAQIKAIPVDENGILDYEFIADHVGHALMICTMAVNNETGVYQDLAQLEQVIRNHNQDVSWMVDCVQALGKQALALSETSIDYAPFSGHKLYAPKGIGFLYIRQNSPYTPFIAGGGQESGMRSGTENLPGIAGLHELFSLLLDTQDDTFKDSKTLHGYRLQLIATLTDTFGDITYNAPLEGSVPTTLNFSVDNLTSKEVMDLFDAAGIRVSGGSACSSGAARSFVLDAMGASQWQSENAIRMSFGPAATQAQIDLACERIRQLKTILENNCLIVSDALQPEQELCALGLTQLRHQGSCCWIYVAHNNETLIVDPIVELIPRISQLVKQQNLLVKAVVETHTPQDKSSAQTLLCQKLNLPETVQLSVADRPVSLGSAELSALATPGHSKDSVSYLLSDNEQVKLCFCGDLMVWGGIGSVAYSDSSMSELIASLRLLDQHLSAESVLCTAHDYEQCYALSWQAQCNATPLLVDLLSGAVDESDFAEHHLHIQQQGAQQKGILCGFSATKVQSSATQLNFDDVNDAIRTDKNTVLLDVREPYEHDARDLRTLFNTDVTQLENVPLSRLANALYNQSLAPNKRYILVCRTGNRSTQAANNLKALGFNNVYNLQGGLALV